MRRGACLLFAFGLLAGCSHDAEPGRTAAGSAAPAPDCSQPNWRLRWQAETAPVITKRQGQDALETFDAEGDGPAPCP